jgi:hypothetical protein
MGINNSITKFKDGFNGGTRANRFLVTPTWPSGVVVDRKDTPFKIVSASLPLVQINTISVPYRGRQITFAGDRQYSTWAVGIYDDNNVNNLWKGMQKWVELLDGHYTHKVYRDDYSYKQLQTTWNIQQLGLNGDVLKTIYLYKCWPSVIGEINLNMGEVGFVGFSVTLTFDHIKIVDNYNINTVNNSNQ